MYKCFLYLKYNIHTVICDVELVNAEEEEAYWEPVEAKNAEFIGKLPPTECLNHRKYSTVQ